MSSTVENMLWSLSFALMGAIAGVVLVIVASAFIPKIVDRLTPNIDEQMELARGNQAVAQYFGRVSAATILGVSIVIAAAILAGIVAGLH